MFNKNFPMNSLKPVILAIDWGEQRIGLALSDDLRVMAHPYGVIENGETIYEKIRELTQERNVGLIIIGLPLTLAGEEGNMADKVRTFGITLSQSLPDIPIEYIDERLTSSAARNALRAGGKSTKKAKKALDALAAGYLLETYLELIRGDSPDNGNV